MVRCRFHTNAGSYYSIYYSDTTAREVLALMAAWWGGVGKLAGTDVDRGTLATPFDFAIDSLRKGLCIR